MVRRATGGAAGAPAARLQRVAAPARARAHRVAGRDADAGGPEREGTARGHAVRTWAGALGQTNAVRDSRYGGCGAGPRGAVVARAVARPGVRDQSAIGAVA